MSDALQATVGVTSGAADGPGVSTAIGRSYLDSTRTVTNGRRNHGTGRRSATPYAGPLGLLYVPQGTTAAGRSDSLVKGRPRSLVKSRGTLVRKKAGVIA